MRRIRSDRPLEPIQLAALAAVNDAATSLDVPYIVAGATARDILLTHVFNLSAYRATSDIDVAIGLGSWEQFETIKSHLIRVHAFKQDPRSIQRLYKNDYPVDVIPFRGVEAPDRTIAWPPDLDTVMNVAGYEDALSAAETVAITESLRIPVVSLPGLAMLKLFAWADRGHHNAKDAADFMIVLQRYANAGNEERLYAGDAVDAMEAADYRIDHAGARLLGRDTKKLMSPDTNRRISQLLANAGRRHSLTVAMAGPQTISDDAQDEAEALLEHFELGLAER